MAGERAGLLHHGAERLERRRQDVALDLEQPHRRPPQRDDDRDRDPGRDAVAGLAPHDGVPRPIWPRRSCTRSTKAGSKLVSSERGRAKPTLREAFTWPGRAHMTCTVSAR